MINRLKELGFKKFRIEGNKVYLKSMSIHYNIETVIVDTTTNEIVSYYISNSVLESQKDIDRLQIDFNNLKSLVEKLCSLKK